MATSDFAEAKAYLTANGSGGNNLYDHLSEVLLKLVSERPNQSHELFEHISMVVKTAKFKPGNGLEGAQFDASAAQQDAEDAMAEWTRKTTEMFGAVGEDPGAVEALNINNIMADLDKLEWATMGYGREEAYRIEVAMAALGMKNEGADIQGMRFWGKILGTGGDYYVVEVKGSVPGPEKEVPDEENPEYEMGATGPNNFTYFVANSPEGAWTKLPNIKSSQIAAATQLRRFLTGDVNAPVQGHPPFDGLEKEYLRAQIARISADCTLAPTGSFEEPEDKAEGLQPPEEKPELSAEGCAEAAGWQKIALPLQGSGRCVSVPAVDEDGNPGEVEYPPLLTDLGEDEFVLRRPAGQNRDVVTLRSSKWPGASTVFCGGGYCWTYSGYGHPKPTTTTYTPTAPAAPSTEFDDMTISEAMDVIADPTPPAEDEEEG